MVEKIDSSKIVFSNPRRIDNSNVVFFNSKKNVYTYECVKQEPKEIRFDQLATAIDSFCQKYEAYKTCVASYPYTLKNERAEEDCCYYGKSLFEQMKTVANDTQDIIDLLKSCERTMEKIQDLMQDSERIKEELPYIEKDFI